MLDPTIPPPMSTTSAVCMSVRGASGTGSGYKNSAQHHDAKPAEDHGERSATFDFADAGDTDGGQDQSPEGEHIQRCQQGAKDGRTVGADEISGIGSDGILNIESIAADTSQQRNHRQQRRQQLRQPSVDNQSE